MGSVEVLELFTGQEIERESACVCVCVCGAVQGCLKVCEYVSVSVM